MISWFSRRLTAAVSVTPASARMPALSLRSSQWPISVQPQPRAAAAWAGRLVVKAPKLPPTAVSARKTPWQPSSTRLSAVRAAAAGIRWASGKKSTNSASAGS